MSILPIFIYNIVLKSNLFSKEQCIDILDKLDSFDSSLDHIKYKLIAENFVKLKKIKFAILFYKKAIGENENFEYLVNIAILYKNIGNIDKAIVYLNKAKFYKQNQFLYKNLVECFIIKKEIKHAKDELSNCEHILAQDLFYFYIGQISYLEKDFDSEIYFYKEAFLKNKKNEYAMKIIDFYLEHRQYSKAKIFIDSIEMDTQLIIKKAEVIRLNESAKKSCEFLEKYIDSENNNIDILIELSKYKRLDYDIVGADKYLIQAKKINNDNKNIALELAKLEKSKGNQKKYYEQIGNLLNMHKFEYRICTY